MNKNSSEAIHVNNPNMTSGAIEVKGNTLLHISGENGESCRWNNKPYTITLYREKWI